MKVFISACENLSFLQYTFWNFLLALKVGIMLLGARSTEVSAGMGEMILKKGRVVQYSC
jgi:hypothetical protein